MTQERQFQEALADGENCPEDCEFLQITREGRPYGETTVYEIIRNCVCDFAEDCLRVK